MFKQILFLLFACLSVCVFAEEKFTFNCKNVELVDKLIASAANEYKKADMVAFKNVMNFSGTYDEYKKAIASAYASIKDEKTKNMLINNKIAQLAFLRKDLNQFRVNVIDDFGVGAGKCRYVDLYVFSMIEDVIFNKYNNDEYCNIFINTMRLLVATGVNNAAYRLNLTVEKFANRIIDLKPELAKATLKKAKILLYGDLGNEKIKPIVVKIELTLKSLE